MGSNAPALFQADVVDLFGLLGSFALLAFVIFNVSGGWWRVGILSFLTCMLLLRFLPAPLFELL